MPEQVIMPPLRSDYFPFAIQTSACARQQFRLQELVPVDASRYPAVLVYRRLAITMARSGLGPAAATAAQLNLYATLLRIYRYLVDTVADEQGDDLLSAALQQAGIPVDSPDAEQTFALFEQTFPPEIDLEQLDQASRRHLLLRELLLLNLASRNRAVDPLRLLLDDREMAAVSPYQTLVGRLEQSLAKGPQVPGIGMTLVEALRAPLTAAPASLAGQLGYIREQWGELLPPELLEEVLTAFDILDEEQRQWSDGGPGPSQVLQFGGGVGGAADGSADAEAAGQAFGAGHHAGYEQHEYEAFSPDADWMANVVMMAKMTHVWLAQLSRQYGHPLTRLDQVPDGELDRLAAWGFTGLWLIGLWERSAASQRIKQLCGNPEAHASAYSLFDYTIAADLGGEEAFHNLKTRAWQRGIRLASDMVPNHTGIYSRWVLEHPDWFVQTDYAPFPTYQFNGEDLSHDPLVTIQIEDGYWTKQDAAVVFRMLDRRDGRTRYLYHGNDGTSIPWNDTAQLNYLLPQVREAVLQTILHVARLTPIIRFDAAMTLAKKHYQRLWFPQRGLGGGIPSRAEHAMSRDEFDAVFPQEFWREVVDRVAAEAPGTLLLAEAFWLMEGYFVRTLGMHRVYNSAFMNMLKKEENAKYRQTVRNVLEFNPEVLKRFVNFMNNPDEKTAVEQFGSQGKYFGCCVLLATMPGLPMFGHGQIEGYREKYGMEYRRAYWDEPVDQGMVRGHELWIFPLLKRRWLFSGSEQFALYDFFCNDGRVDENVFAYSNRAGQERCLVVYHNCHAQTAGWIKASVPVAMKGDTDQVELHSSTLGAALAVPEDATSFVAFRDLSTGLEYLRTADEIHQQGLYVELGEYEFHVFLDFRIMVATPDTPWQLLYADLAGSGVWSVEEALIQLMHRPLIAAFESCLQSLPKFLTDEAEAAAALAAYRQELPAATAALLDLKQLSHMLTAAHDPAVAAAALRGLRAAGVRRSMLPLNSENRRCALAMLLVGELALPLGVDSLQRYGLAHPLAGFVTGMPASAPERVRWLGELCRAVVRSHRLWSAASPEQSLEVLFADPAAAGFMLVHQDNGTSWFNKECFEILLQWLALLVAFDRARGQDLPLVPYQELNELAAAAGYRVRSMLHLYAAFRAG
ncbi:MAG: alpha-amylase [Geobacter sp.]|nr:alpha-amylase [Geobacter sp.]